jgi:hypothetical protein
MNVFRHDNISVNAHLETQPRTFEAFEKMIVSVRRCELGLPLIATEGEEMGLAGLVESFQSACHAASLRRSTSGVSGGAPARL